jgi:hypothetical protein
MAITKYFVVTDDVYLSSIIQRIQAMIVEEEPYFEIRQACKRAKHVIRAFKALI